MQQTLLIELVTLSDDQTTVAINGSTRPTLDIRAGTTAFGTPGIIPANSVGSGKGGTLDITAASILLSDRGKLIAQPTNSDEGNIQLSALDLLLMRNNSLISATAGGTGNGGNIAIDADNGFIVAVPKENSDITANASRGRGVISTSRLLVFMALSSAHALQKPLGGLLKKMGMSPTLVFFHSCL